MPGREPSLPAHGQQLSGDYLMKIGLDVFTGENITSKMIEITRVD
ncbi:MAG: GH36 C-terminal domain-containing protein [Candidatus Azobacteroides sp.]|nr:GH36 C-terminal domain-containing protein [Candidatus Azobacteroides sp.]